MHLKEFRQRKGLSQLKLAALSGVSQSCIFFIEVGATRFPRPETINKLAFALGVDPAELVGEEK